MTTTEIRQEILKKIHHLSEQQLNQVLQFINQVNQPSENTMTDPLADFIGKVDHGTLAQNCDRELYE
jgi:hypothetical protein